MKKPERHSPVSMVSISCVIIGCLLSPHAIASDVSHGEMSGAIRSAGFPCSQVLQVDSNGENDWDVQCNSGQFNVSRDENGNFAVTRIE